MISVKDIAWIAGLVEGEGCIGICNKTITLKVTMTDKDVIDRLALLWKNPVSAALPGKGSIGRKRLYTVALHGSEAAQWLMTLYCFFGERRQRRAREALADWRLRRYYKRKGAFRPALCHPDKAYYAKEMCRTCYRKQYPFNWNKPC